MRLTSWQLYDRNFNAFHSVYLTGHSLSPCNVWGLYHCFLIGLSNSSESLIFFTTLRIVPYLCKFPLIWVEFGGDIKISKPWKLQWLRFCLLKMGLFSFQFWASIWLWKDRGAFFSRYSRVVLDLGMTLARTFPNAFLNLILELCST